MTTWTQLEDRLMDEGEPLRAQLQAQLEEAALRLKTRLAVPMSRDEFAACHACAQALDAAMHVLGRWTPPRPDPSRSASGVVACRQRLF